MSTNPVSTNPISANTTAQLFWAIQQAMRLRGEPLDRLHLEAAAAQAGAPSEPLADVRRVSQLLELTRPKALKRPDLAQAPMLAFVKATGWGVIVGRSPQGAWILQQEEGARAVPEFGADDRCLRLGTPTRSRAADGPGKPLAMIRSIFASYRGVIIEAVLATVFASVLAIGASLFSMQVYDRVIPTRGESTLFVLCAGVLIAILVEAALKFARAKIMDSVIIGVDNTLSREIFQRLLSVRIDQLPGSVGSLAGQLRGYEQVRAFVTTRTMFGLVDMPMGLIFLVIIAAIGSPLIAIVPFVATAVAIAMGLLARRRINQLAQEGAQSSNRRIGLLVETVDGAETIKAGAGGWKFLSRWLDLSAKTLHNDLHMRHASEGLGYWGAALQQISYAAVVAVGAMEAIGGHITGGAVMACSILASRVLTPVLALPGLIVQQAQAEAALKGLDVLYTLETDHHGVANPLAPQKLEGQFTLIDTAFSYPDNQPAIQVAQLHIKPGERIGILGPIGSGKSTLLRVLAGIYRPQKGRVLLDGLDMTHINRQLVSEQVGYLQQDHRLFQGTLRENLLIGLPDPGDDAMHKALVRSGLITLVSGHPRGLDLPIREGGTGLSGGQRQLVAFSRLLLTQSPILLLDEPTASMDDAQERRCLSVLAEELRNSERTMVVVTHKHSMLPLVNRLIVVADNRIVLDGPRDQVLAHLAQRASQAAGQGATASVTTQAAPALRVEEEETPLPTLPAVPDAIAKAGKPPEPISIARAGKAAHMKATL